MARRVALLVTTEVVCVETGHWCNRCLLSSGIRVRYAVATGPTLCFHTQTGCMDCDHDDVELVDAPTTIWKS
jgi:hypothetical protein